MDGPWPKVSSSSAHRPDVLRSFADVVRRRRMTRSFREEPVPSGLFEECVELATRAPSAGKTAGWSLVVLSGDDTSRYWDIALPAEKRETFAFPGLLRAPLVAIACCDPGEYLARYSEPDKRHTGLGASADTWPAPYWTIDASFAVMTLLYALEERGLGALFFAHANEVQLRSEFAIPDHVQILGALCVGYADDTNVRPGRSATRARASVNHVIRRGSYTS